MSTAISGGMKFPRKKTHEKLNRTSTAYFNIVSMYVVTYRVITRKIRYVDFILSLSTRNIFMCLFYDSAIFYRYCYFNYDTDIALFMIQMFTIMQ